MPESTSTASRSEGAAGREREERLRIKLVTGAILLVLALVVATLRFQRLGELPQGLSHDEGVDGILALQVLQGEHAVFFLGPGSSGRDASAIYALALSTSLLGRTLLAMHLPTALGSAGMVFVVFWLGRLLFGKDENGRANAWRGLLIGGVGAGLLAVSLNQTIIGRASFNNVTHTPLLLALSLALLWQGWTRQAQGGRSWWRIALAGACAGLLLYTYVPARITPFLFLFFGLSFLLHWAWLDGGREKKRWRALFPLLASRLRAELPWAGVFAGAAMLAAAPLFIHFAQNPEHLFWRSGQLWVFDSSRSQGDPLGALWGNVREHLMVFGFRGDPNWERNFANRPMLNLWEAFFFWLGVGVSLWRWQRPAYRLLLLWLCMLILPAMLAIDVTPPPNTLRMNGAAPAVYLLIGAGIWEAVQFFGKQFSPPPGSTARNIIHSFFRADGRSVATAVGATAVGATVVGAVVSGLVLFQGAITHHTYFQRWAVAPETYDAFDTEWTELALTLNAQPSDTNVVYLVSYLVNGHPSFEYLYQGKSAAHVVDANRPDLAQKLRATLAAMEGQPTVRVVDWEGADAPWAGAGEENLVLLMSKYGRYRSSDEFASFQIHTYTDVAVDRPWTFYEFLEPLTVRYDGGIDLRGVAIGQGTEQLSSQHLLELGESRSLWLGLQWQTHAGLDTDFAISMRLHGAGGVIAFQRDVVLGNPDHARTSLWSADETVDTLFHLDFPAELQPGEYELRVIVYDGKTLVPTVEIDVWEAEMPLARLHFSKLR